MTIWSVSNKQAEEKPEQTKNLNEIVEEHVTGMSDLLIPMFRRVIESPTAYSINNCMHYNSAIDDCVKALIAWFSERKPDLSGFFGNLMNSAFARIQWRPIVRKMIASAFRVESIEPEHAEDVYPDTSYLEGKFLERYQNGEFHYLIVGAKAEIEDLTDERSITINAGGIGGIESISDEDHIESIEQEEMDTLKTWLKEFVWNFPSDTCVSCTHFKPKLIFGGRLQTTPECPFQGSSVIETNGCDLFEKITDTEEQTEEDREAEEEKTEKRCTD